jgi:hypothetical protein
VLLACIDIERAHHGRHIGQATDAEAVDVLQERARVGKKLHHAAVRRRFLALAAAAQIAVDDRLHRRAQPRRHHAEVAEHFPGLLVRRLSCEVPPIVAVAAQNHPVPSDHSAGDDPGIAFIVCLATHIDWLTLEPWR